MAKKPKPPAAYSLSFPRYATELGVTLDARGLLPLERARAIVASVDAYERDARDGRPAGDVVWLALLSLEDGAELARAAARLEWRFPFLRGWDNEDAVLRYGVGALPWLEALLDRQRDHVGSIPAVPFHFVGTHLLAIGAEAVSAVLRVKRDGDADPDGLGFVNDWLARHGAPAWGALATRATNGDAAARRALDALARRSPSGVRKLLSAALGKDAADRALTGSKELEASAILSVLDAAASAEIGDRVPWPTIHAGAGHFEFHAIRAIAVRSKKGDDWGVLVELVQGDLCDPEVRWPAVVQRYTYGSKVASGGVYLTDSRPIGVDPGKTKLDASVMEKLDLRPNLSITGRVEDWPSVLAIRATLATKPTTFFPPAKKVIDVLDVPGAQILLETRELEHVDGPMHGQGTFARRPSESVAWRSIADVIASRDPKRFDPGASNTEWRVHATQRQPE